MKLLVDIRHSFRILLKNPMTMLIMVIIMTVGLGMGTYVFSLINTLVLKPVELPHGEKLVIFARQFDSYEFRNRGINGYLANRIREESTHLDNFGLFLADSTSLVRGEGIDVNAEKFNTVYTEWNLFELVNAEPLLGRNFDANDNKQGAEPVVILSHGVWSAYFSGDQKIIGKEIYVNAVKTKVVGVMKKGFSFPSHAQIWQPMPYDYLNPSSVEQSSYNIFAFARLKDNASIGKMQAELKTIYQRLNNELSANIKPLSAEVFSFKRLSVNQHLPLLIAIGFVAFAILLLSSINVGNMLLLRVNKRRSEFSIKLALGAPQHRILLQVLLESVFVALLSFAIAIFLTDYGLEFTNEVVEKAFSIDNKRPFWWQFHIDRTVLSASVIFMMLTVIITGFIPAWRILKKDFSLELKAGTRGDVSKKTGFITHSIMVAEFFLSISVLSVAALAVFTTYFAYQTDYGVRTENVFTGHIELPYYNYANKEQRVTFFTRLKHELDNQSNIKSAGLITDLPGTGGGGSHVDIQNKNYAELSLRPKANTEIVVMGSLEALGYTLIEGRFFTEQDVSKSDCRVIISQSFAKEVFGSQMAVGNKYRRYTSDPNKVRPWCNIIGVVSDVIHGSSISTARMVNSVYLVHTQTIGRKMRVAINYEGNVENVESQLKQILLKMDPNVAVYSLRAFENLIEEPLFIISYISGLFVICGVVAFFITALGVFAVVSNSIEQRTHEIGLRRALGANDRHVFTLFLHGSIIQLGAGLVIGLVFALLIINLMTEFMVLNIFAYLIAFVLVPLFIILVVLLATYLPTRKILILEPSVSLRND